MKKYHPPISTQKLTVYSLISSHVRRKWIPETGILRITYHENIMLQQADENSSVYKQTKRKDVKNASKTLV